jgi:hypothetical protein
MAKELKPVDITNTPEVLRLAEEVARSGVTHVLRRDDQDLVEVRPISPTSKRAKGKGRPRRKRSVDNSWLENIVGIADESAFPNQPTDISTNVDKYLADAYYGKSQSDK